MVHQHSCSYCLFRNDHGVWCLTTGREWIFALVANNEGRQRAAYALDSMKIDFNSASLQDDLRAVFFTLVYWVCILLNVIYIYNTFFLSKFVVDPKEIKTMLRRFAHC